jgi:hypothetical protein
MIKQIKLLISMIGIILLLKTERFRREIMQNKVCLEFNLIKQEKFQVMNKKSDLTFQDITYQDITLIIKAQKDKKVFRLDLILTLRIY